MITMHRKDASNAFKQALQAFGVTWERKTRPAEKVPILASPGRCGRLAARFGAAPRQMQSQRTT